MATPRIRELVINALIGIVATVALAVLTGAWATKETTVAHSADIVAIRRGLDSLAAGQTRILDAICNQTTPRICSSK